MKIQINKLKLNEGQVKDVPKNPRFIKDDKYEKLKKSLTEDPEFMDYNPVLIYDNNGELIVMGGNMRVRAAKELGWKEINGEVMPYDTPAQTIRARIIKHNSGYGSDDWDLLSNEWSDDPLPDWGLDVPNDWNQSEVVEDEAPPIADVAVSKLGEIYQLGRHRVMCGDATKTEDIHSLMGEQKADLVFIDPPYNVDYSGRGRNELGKIKNDAMSDDDFSGFLSEVFTNCSDLMKSGASIYVCHPDSVSNAKIAFEVRFAESFKKSSTIIWAKQSAVMGWQDYRVQHEPILYGWKGNSHSFFAGRDKTTIWDISRDAQASYTHPTQKPVVLPAEAIKNSSKGDDIVVDLFGGSGSTLIACEQLDRTCYGMELDPKYVDVIRKRYWKFTHDNNEEGWEDGTPAIA